jgi:flagellar protein FliS
MGANPYLKYQKVQVETADKGKLLIMLYDGALKFLKASRAAIEENKIEKANHNLLRCQDIIAEMMASLDLEAGEVAKNLFVLYEYLLYLLVQANIKKDKNILSQVEKMLLELKETWLNILSPRTGIPT